MRDYPWVLVPISAMLIIMALVTHAPAADLPHGLTCEVIAQHARTHNIGNTMMGRIRARALALMYGITFTTAQLDAAARCLRSKS